MNNNPFDKDKKFQIRDRIQSFRYAFNGWKILYQNEHNFRIHLFAGGVAILLAFYFRFRPIEWIVLTLTIGFVFFAETVNSSIEYLSDAITKESNLEIQYAKDLAAGAVLFSALVSLVVGGILFIPRIIRIIL